MGKPILYLDMDGVIVDLFGYAADITGVTDTKELSQEQFDKFFAGHDAEELFADLPKFDSADKLISIIDQLAGSYNILSSPLAEDKPGSIRGKNRWLDNNISIMPAKRVFDHEKYKYAKQSDGTPNILIDDYKFNINKWREAGGIAIRYRADRMSPEDIVTELKIALDNGGNETISERLSRRWYAVKSAVNESDVEMKLSPESKLIDEVELSETLKRVKGKWALVSKSNPKKVLQYYRGGDERPSKEWVNKVERRVHSFGESTESGDPVIFLNKDTVIVGQEHGHPVKLSTETLQKVKEIVDKHGAWFEGNGADNAYIPKSLVKKWLGSWDDDEVAKKIKGYPPEFLYVLFANVDANNRIDKIGEDPESSIFDQIVKNKRDNTYFSDRTYDAATLKKFLQMISEPGYDFVKMSQEPATRENVKKFLKTGEKRMWPSNWEDYPNPAGKVAQKATIRRDMFLVKAPPGAYFAGAGHLVAVKELMGGKSSGLTEMGGVGVVATNPKMAKDPRYSTSMTVDIGPGETQKQAKKMGFDTDKLGIPPRLSPSGVVPRKKPPK